MSCADARSGSKSVRFLFSTTLVRGEGLRMCARPAPVMFLGVLASAAGGRSNRGGISTGVAACSRGALGAAICKACSRNCSSQSSFHARNVSLATVRKPTCTQLHHKRSYSFFQCPTMRRLMITGALSRVDGAEQSCLQRLSWTMRCEDQSSRQTVSQLKRGVVDLLQDILPLTHGKDAIAIFSAGFHFIQSPRSLGHRGIAINHMCFDRALLKPLSRLFITKFKHMNISSIFDIKNFIKIQ